MKTENKNNVILKSCQQIADKYFEEPSIILFGSRAKGDYKNHSDWDILVLIKNEVDKKQFTLFYDEIYELELELEEVIIPIVRIKAKWNDSYNKATPFYKTIESDGIIYAG